MAVDTHVFRVAARIGLTFRAKNPYQAEMQLIEYIPEDKIRLAHHWLILHGRYVCQARKPKCENCGIASFCEYYKRLERKSGTS
jgi:endonuclease-3